MCDNNHAETYVRIRKQAFQGYDTMRVWQVGGAKVQIMWMKVDKNTEINICCAQF